MSARVTPEDFDFEWFSKIKALPRKVGNQGNRKKVKYLDIITAFDIETTRIVEIEQAVMYVWQWQFGLKYTVIGRTWDEFINFKNRLNMIIPDGITLCSFVHNLSYEFQFFRGIHDFRTEDVFALAKRKVLKACMGDKLEFRCSYLHSNMGLNEYTH